MKVRVKEDKKGFIYGVYRVAGDIFDLKNPETEFSSIWMEKVTVKKAEVIHVVEEAVYEPVKEPAQMKVNELKSALMEAGIDIPDGVKKDVLVELLEDYQTSPGV